MADIVTVTRHHSGLRNVADSYHIGNFECDGDASIDEYVLPDGYELHKGELFDPAGCLCVIVPGGDGGPILFSLLGRVPPAPLRRHQAQ